MMVATSIIRKDEARLMCRTRAKFTTMGQRLWTDATDASDLFQGLVQSVHQEDGEPDVSCFRVAVRRKTEAALGYETLMNVVPDPNWDMCDCTVCDQFSGICGRKLRAHIAAANHASKNRLSAPWLDEYSKKFEKCK